MSRGSPNLVLAMRAAGFVLALLVTAELLVRFCTADLAFLEGPCKATMTAAGRPHPHLFKTFVPNCHTRTRANFGGDYAFDTNEDGLRERPRGEFRDEVVAVLGDSAVEGWGLDVEQALPRQLEREGAGVVGGKTINVGLRGIGPTLELDLLRKIRDQYRIRKLIWILTENDILDEKVLKLQKESDWLERLQAGLKVFSHDFLSGRYATAEYLRIFLYQVSLQRAAQAPEVGGAMASYFCERVRDVLNVIDPAVPIFVVAIPQGIPGRNHSYQGVALDRKSFWESMECIGASPIHLIREVDFFAKSAPHFLPDEVHLDGEGTRNWARDLIGELRKFQQGGEGPRRAP